MSSNQEEERERKRKIEVQEAQRRQLEIALRRMENNPLKLDVDIVELSTGNEVEDSKESAAAAKHITIQVQIEALPEVQC